MKLAIGSDHAGFAYKEAIKTMLAPTAIRSTISGPTPKRPSTTPTSFVPWLKRLPEENSRRGIVLGGQVMARRWWRTGFAASAAACAGTNRWRSGTGRTTTQTCCSLGQRTIAEADALAIVRVWLATPFEGGRHIGRIRKIDERCK